MVEIGIGTNKKNIDEWVNEIWQNYVKKDDDLLRKDEFSRFVKNCFRITHTTFVPTDTELN